VNSKEAAVLASKHFRRTWEKLTEREQEILRSVISGMHVSRPIQREIDSELTLGQRVADRVARFGGSWTFMGIFFTILLCWMGINSYALQHPYDPYPFILLNLLLSCLAAVQAPIILMSQSRQADTDRQQATHDYEVNLKAEIEIMQIHEKIDLLRTQELTRIVEMQETQAKMLELLVGKHQGGSAS
jgi:uncharacterized membrane protein